MGKEIERKFLVKDRSFKNTYEGHHEIKQGYLAIDEKKVIRVRTLDDKGFITIKGKPTGITRSEFEYEIPKREALEMMQTLCDSLIEKIRYIVPIGGMNWEIDEFINENQGLVVAEIELDTESRNFEIPEWLGPEVTHDKRYYNAYLSIHPFKKWG